jgi:hypothetical protein
MENANLTKAQDLGSVTELLSGDFNVPFGRSTSHQLWSSAMVITPILRGLFGISIDAQSKTITVNPHLPAYWDDAAIRHLQVPTGSFDLVFTRDGASLRVGLSSVPAITGWRLRSDIPGAKTDKGENDDLVLPLPTVEVGNLAHNAAVPGSRTSELRVLKEEWGTNHVTFTAEAPAGSTAMFPIRRHKLVKLRLTANDGLPADAPNDQPGVSLTAIDTAFRDPNLPFGLYFHFPPGEGWKTITVTLTW